MTLQSCPAQIVSCPALAEIAQLDQWVISKYVQGRDKDGNVKRDKPPFSPHTKRKCSHSDPLDWSSYETAVSALPGFDWLGFVFHMFDPYSGIDLDGCRDPETGELEE
jgi:primase-polymerase (primpol)-like protein